MHRSVDHDDWRRAERFDPSVLFTVTIGIIVAAALVSLV